MTKRHTKETFTAAARLIHGDRYDYSRTHYINADTPTTITCPKHGSWEQTPANHLNGRGCWECARDKTRLNATTAQQIGIVYSETKSMQETARILGVGETSVSRYLRRAGVTPIGKGGRRKLSSQQEQEVLILFDSGETTASLRKSFGVSRQTIINILRRHGRPISPVGVTVQGIADCDKHEIISLFMAGKRIEFIKKATGYSRKSIAIFLQSMGFETSRGAARGEEHGSWKGGTVTTGGYRAIRLYPDDPYFCMLNKRSDHYVLEHRLVMARHLGRPLEDWESVHHKDANRTNNAIENLQLRTGQHGKGACYHCLDCGSYRIGPAPL